MFGFHPLAAFADHGTGAAGEALPIMLRPGNARSNTASEHIDVIRLALAQVPGRLRRRVLIRTDPGGGTSEFLAWLAGRRLHYSVGMTISEDIAEASSPSETASGNRLMARRARSRPATWFPGRGPRRGRSHPGQRRGQSQQSRPVLGVQAAERSVRMLQRRWGQAHHRRLAALGVSPGTDNPCQHPVPGTSALASVKSLAGTLARSAGLPGGGSTTAREFVPVPSFCGSLGRHAADCGT
jgi:Transposase DDE domain group 1